MTEREKTVLRMYAEGKPYKVICSETGLTEVGILGILHRHTDKIQWRRWREPDSLELLPEHLERLNEVRRRRANNDRITYKHTEEGMMKLLGKIRGPRQGFHQKKKTRTK